MLRAVFVGLLLIAFVAPAEAQSRRELAARLDAVEARLAEAESQSLQGDPVADALMARLDAMEREQRVLTGEIERLAFENRRMRTELEQLGRTVDALLAGGAGSGGDGGPALLEPDEIDSDDPFAEARAGDVRPLQAPDGAQAQRPAGTVDGGRPGADRSNASTRLSATRSPSGAGPARLDEPSQAAPADPGALFAGGRARLLDGDFSGAREVFERYTEAFPDGEQAGEAWYWLGETHFVSGEFDAAAESYINSLRTDRRGPRGADALVRLGASLAALDQVGRACEVLATFPQEFPNASSDARRKAQREISRIGCS